LLKEGSIYIYIYIRRFLTRKKKKEKRKKKKEKRKKEKKKREKRRDKIKKIYNTIMIRNNKKRLEYLKETDKKR